MPPPLPYAPAPPQKHKAVGQYQRFFARLVASLPSKDAASELLHSLLQELAGHLDAESKHVRHQCTHMLVHVLGALPQHTDIAEDLQEQLCSGLVARLHDKQAVIRAAAAQALAGLAHHTKVVGPEPAHDCTVGNDLQHSTILHAVCGSQQHYHKFMLVQKSL